MQQPADFAESTPEWLCALTAEAPFPREDFFASRTLYYPGSGTDGHPIAVFNQEHAIHCAIYADYGLSLSALKKEIYSANHGFRGYHIIIEHELTQQDLRPGHWQLHVSKHEVRGSWISPDFKPYALFVVFQRDEGLGEQHGAERLAVIFLGADGIATYDALFCQRDSGPPPFILVLQDHGFGGNYTRFGKGGLLHELAKRTGTFPDHVFVAKYTDVWDDYEPLPMPASVGGMHGIPRKLWKRKAGALIG